MRRASLLYKAVFGAACLFGLCCLGCGRLVDRYWLYRCEVDFNIDLFADEDAAGFEGDIPVQSIVFAVNCAFYRECGALHSIEIL